MVDLPILPRDLPDAVLPLGQDDTFIVDQGAGALVSKCKAPAIVDAVAPLATQTEAEIGTNNVKRTSPLRVKQSIAAEVGVTVASYAAGQAGLSAVQSVNGKTGTSVVINKADVGLGNVSNLAPADMPVSTATQTALDAKVNSTIAVNAGDGLAGGGILTASREISLSATSLAAIALANSAVQPGSLGALATKNQVAISDIAATGTPSSGTFLRGDGTWGTVAGAGTVTSVAMTVPTGLSVAGSPITGSGTFAVTHASGYQGYTTTEATKLSGISVGATANQTNAYLLNRSNHTGTQEIGTVDGLQTALDGKLSISSGTALSSNTIDTQLQIRGGGNRVVRFQKADGTRAGAVSSNGDNSSVEIFVDNPTNTVSKTFRCNSDGQLILPDSPNLAGSATRKDYVDAAVAGAGGLGIGQTWQDVTASRASNTSYQNTSGKPIAVAITMDGTPTTLRLEFQVSSNNSTWYWLSDLQPYNASAAINKFFGGGVVPDGYYYRAIRSAANTWRWMELR